MTNKDFTFDTIFFYLYFQTSTTIFKLKTRLNVTVTLFKNLSIPFHTIPKLRCLFVLLIYKKHGVFIVPSVTIRIRNTKNPETK